MNIGLRFGASRAATPAKPISGSMYDFACQITASEIFPSSAFSFKMLDPTVLIHVSPVPERLKRSIECAIYSVTWIFNYVSHDDVVPSRLT
jgi:hypothetical protein